jgi:hypothetical protein
MLTIDMAAELEKLIRSGQEFKLPIPPVSLSSLLNFMQSFVFVLEPCRDLNIHEQSFTCRN